MGKLEIAILSTFFGWFLAQGTEYLRYRHGIRKKKSAILGELSEIKSILDDSSKSALNAAQSNQVIMGLSSKIDIRITDVYYDEIAYLFSDKERFNFRFFLIHLNNFNRGIDWFAGYKQGSSSSIEIKQKIIEQYKQALMASLFLSGFLDGNEKITDNHEKMNELREIVSKNVSSIFS